MTGQAIHTLGTADSGRHLGLHGPITEAAQLAIDNEPDFKAELKRLALEDIQLDGQESVEERLRERCESHAGLDINANDMLTPLAREMLLHAFSSVDWQSLAEKLVEPQIETVQRDRRPESTSGIQS